jgi:hypothetical protein
MINHEIIRNDYFVKIEVSEFLDYKPKKLDNETIKLFTNFITEHHNEINRFNVSLIFLTPALDCIIETLKEDTNIFTLCKVHIKEENEIYEIVVKKYDLIFYNLYISTIKEWDEYHNKYITHNEFYYLGTDEKFFKSFETNIIY